MNNKLQALERAKTEHSIIKQGFPEQEYIETLNEIEKELKEKEQYKDIEKELDIDLITLFKAMKNGIWVNETTGYHKHLTGVHFIYSDDLLVEIECGRYLSATIYEMWYEDLDNVMLKTGCEWLLDEYGKTWALTREELL